MRIDHVVHDPMVTHAQPVEGVMCAANRLDLLAGDTGWLGCVGRKILQGLPDPLSELGGKPVERANGGGRQLD